MEQFENENIDPEAGENTPVNTEQQQNPCNGTAAGRKESPFANSPYYTNTESQQQNTYNTERGNGFYDVPPVEPKKKKKKGSGKAIIAAALTVAVIAGSCAATALIVDRQWQHRAEQLETSFNTKVEELQKQVEAASAKSNGTSISGSPVSSVEGMTPSEVYARNVNSVVAISNQATTNFFGQISKTASSGSGFILTEDGYVVTNYHVVAGANTLTVITFDSTEYDAKVIGYDEANDVALLKIEATGLQPVTIGSSDDLIIGDQVVAIGNPLGELTSTLTVGYLSAKDRAVSTEGSYISMMQTDAAINPGNSGGPLFNMKGEVIGITTAKYSGTTGSGASIEGIGFAIPIDDVMDMMSDLREHGYVSGASLGVSVYSMDQQTADRLGLPLGSLVDAVTEGSCAEKAGVQETDIIIGLGDYKVENNSDLLLALRKYKAGDTTNITVYRGGKEVSLSITLDEKPHAVQKPEIEAPAEGGEMPSDGSYEEWYEYFAPFFGNGEKD